MPSVSPSRATEKVCGHSFSNINLRGSELIRRSSTAADFDNKVVKLCADKSLTVQQRRERIGQFIKVHDPFFFSNLCSASDCYLYMQDADGIHTLSKGIMTKLNDLKSDLTDFIASFEAWVNKIVQGWNAMIKEVQRELEDAMRDIERIRAAAAAAMGLPYYYATSTELVSLMFYLGYPGRHQV